MVWKVPLQLEQNGTSGWPEHCSGACCPTRPDAGLGEKGGACARTMPCSSGTVSQPQSKLRQISDSTTGQTRPAFEQSKHSTYARRTHAARNTPTPFAIPKSPTAHNDWKRWRRRSPCSVAPNQLSFPSAATTHHGPDLAVRAAVDPHRWHHSGKRSERLWGLPFLTGYLGI